MNAVDLADTAATPAELLDLVRGARAGVDAFEVEIAVIAVEWAHSHPVLPGDRAWTIKTPAGAPLGEYDAQVAGPRATFEDVEWFAIPPVRWDAPCLLYTSPSPRDS